MTTQDMSQDSTTRADPEYTALYRRLRAEGGIELREQLHTRYLELGRGAVTPGGLPYPDPTDPVAEGANAIRALAEALDTTGWQAANIAGVVYKVMSGKLVEVRSDSGGISGNFIDGNTTVANIIPAPVRPTTRNGRGVAYMTGGYVGIAAITGAGDLVITQRSGAARTSAAFSVLYFLG